MNLLKVFYRTWWGVQPKKLLSLCSSFVRPYLDLDSLVYYNCPKELLKKLDNTFYKVIRVAMGYIGSTPINVILT